MKKGLACLSVEGKFSSSELYQKINFFWRWLATGFGFLLFGIGGAFLALTVFPCLLIFTKNGTRRSDRVRHVINYVFRAYLAILECLGVMSIETLGLEPLKEMKNKLVICNHPSLLDVAIIMSRLKNVQCLVNAKLWSNPLLGLIVRAAGYLRNDIDPLTFLEECHQVAARGENLIIFPEGTRSVPGGELKLLRGFANLALSAELDIQTLILKCQPSWLIKGVKWYSIPSKKVHILLEAGSEFRYSNYLYNAPRSIRVRALVRDVQHYYEGKLKNE